MPSNFVSVVGRSVNHPRLKFYPGPDPGPEACKSLGLTRESRNQPATLRIGKGPTGGCFLSPPLWKPQMQTRFG